MRLRVKFIPFSAAINLFVSETVGEYFPELKYTLMLLSEYCCAFIREDGRMQRIHIGRKYLSTGSVYCHAKAMQSLFKEILQGERV